MFYRRMLMCAMILVCICFAFGCGSDKPAESKETQTSQADEKMLLKPVTLRGEKTNVLIDLPFEVPNQPQDKSDEISPELQNIILKSKSYTARNEKIVLNVSCSTFNEEVIAYLPEEKFYEALVSEMNANFASLDNNSQFADMKKDYQQTKIDGKPALIATATYLFNNEDRNKSTLVYIFNGAEMWRLIFDYIEGYEPSETAVDSAVKSIKFQ